MNKKWMILTCFFSVLTLISSVICSCLVFYSENAHTNVNSNKVLASNNIYINTSIIYDENNNLNLSGLTPGFTKEQSFSITNNNSNTIKYNMEWTNIKSTWNYADNTINSHPEEFIYSVTCSNGEKVVNKQMPSSDSDAIILQDLELKTNKSNNCTIKISFINNGQDQSYNLNKLFSGTYKVRITK